MAVKKLFRADPYLTSSPAKIVQKEGTTVFLDQTIIYAFSGGQASDKAWINDLEVLKAEKQGKDIAYTLPTNHTLYVGDEVQLRIDWDIRYRLMKLHFVAELVLVLVNELLHNPEKIGANITPEKARIDFIWKENIAQIFPTLEKRLNKLMDANVPIVSAFSDEETERRFRAIEGFAKVPCGGTHIKRTGEIGAVTLKRSNIGKGKERIEMRLVEGMASSKQLGNM